MMKQQQELSYYRLRLEHYLKDYHPQRLGDEAFITMRSERAAEVYEEAFLRGSNPYEAHNEAIATLLEGLEFSPYMVVEDIVEQELNLSIPSELNTALSKLLMAHPEVRKFLGSFDFTEDFEDKAEFQDFRNELIGLLAEIVAENKLLSALQTSQ